MNTTLITNAILVNEGRQFNGHVLIRGDLIAKIYAAPVLPQVNATFRVDAGGKWLLPGLIDDQVHFREPGLTHKGDMHSESVAAVAGGITSFMEMPNTIPQTTTQETLAQKYEMAAERSVANYSFYIGATNNNLSELLKTDPAGVCGIKIFMGSSTGNMLVDNPDSLRAIFSEVSLPIAVHCEDETLIRRNSDGARNQFGEDVPVHLHPRIRSEEACYRSSSLAVELASKYNTRLHILHLSTARETSLLQTKSVLRDKRITAEVCIHHLWFDSRDYHTHGNLIKWNPAIKEPSDREGLLDALIKGKIDVVATDHAPHTLLEKRNPYFLAPSGGPLVQHSLPAMLELCRQKLLTPEWVVEKMCHAPAEVFRIHRRGYIRENYFADLVLVDPLGQTPVTTDKLLYKCGWSPFQGITFSTAVTHTWVNGKLVYQNGRVDDSARGARLVFER